MIESIQQDDFSAIGERADRREIRHVARRKQQRALATCEGGELFFQSGVLGAVTGDQMRGTAANACS